MLWRMNDKRVEWKKNVAIECILSESIDKLFTAYSAQTFVSLNV